jgi:hypothetical protein
MKLSDYDAALEREAVLYPDRADEIAAERERIAPLIESEHEEATRVGDPNVDATVERALAAAESIDDSPTSKKATR